MPKRIMLDLETMGTRPGCAILQIGAVELCEVTGLLGREFFANIDLKSCVDLGLEMDPSTVLWWLDKDADARNFLSAHDRSPISSALCWFRDYLALVSGGKLNRHGRLDIELWGNGASFDCAILRAAYEKAALLPTIEPFIDRCYRTLKGLFPSVAVPEFVGVKHHALDDAKHQARHAIALLRRAQLPIYIMGLDPAAEGTERHVVGTTRDRIDAMKMAMSAYEGLPAAPADAGRLEMAEAVTTPDVKGDMRRTFARVQEIADKELVDRAVNPPVFAAPVPEAAP